MAKFPIAAAAVAATLSLTAIPIASLAGAEYAAPAAPLAAQPDTRVHPVQVSGLDLCGKRDRMVSDLGRQFKERPLATGLVDENALVEIFVSPAGTWTILATGTDGVSCVLAVGEGFEANTQIAGVGV